MRHSLALATISATLVAQTALACDAQVETIHAAQTSGQPLVLEGAACQRSLTLAGSSQDVCYWTYTYRESRAQDRFDMWSQALLACYGAENANLSDQPVNHPDSYTLHRFQSDTTEISLSLKDKAGLGQTLVFLQAAPKP